eukprot:403356701
MVVSRIYKEGSVDEGGKNSISLQSNKHGGLNFIGDNISCNITIHKKVVKKQNDRGQKQVTTKKSKKKRSESQSSSNSDVQELEDKLFKDNLKQTTIQFQAKNADDVEQMIEHRPRPQKIMAQSQYPINDEMKQLDMMMEAIKRKKEQLMLQTQIQLTKQINKQSQSDSQNDDTKAYSSDPTMTYSSVNRTDDDNYSQKTPSKVDLSKSGCRRKRKAMGKRDVYKNVDLEKLNNFLDCDNFLTADSKEVPGFLHEKPQIDVNYWRNIAQGSQQQEIAQTQTYVQNERIQLSLVSNILKNSDNKKNKRRSKNEEQEDQLFDLNVDMNLGKKPEDNFEERQQLYLQSQQPFLTNLEEQEVQTTGILDGVEPADWFFEDDKVTRKRRIILRISKGSIKDKRFHTWLSERKKREEGQHIYELWDITQKELKKRQRTNRNPEDGNLKSEKPKKKKDNQSGKKKLDQQDKVDITQASEVAASENPQEIKLKTQSLFQPRNKFEVGNNVIKVEDGIIKCEYTNQFNIRVNNLMQKTRLSKDMEHFIHLQEKEVKEFQQKQKQNYKIKSEQSNQQIKQEDDILMTDIKGNYLQNTQQFIKDEFGQLKKVTQNQDNDDCIIDKICYEKQKPNFEKIPLPVIKEELGKNGFANSKLGQKGKKETYRVMMEIWCYKKQGEIPSNYQQD